MLRALFRLILILVVLVAAFMFFTGYRFGRAPGSAAPDVVGTSGRAAPIDTDTARARGAQAGEAIAEGANKIGAAASTVAERGSEALADASITAKIKSKMALDESVRALDIDVDTVDGVVTLTGNVGSIAVRDRAVELATETAGVRTVQDRLRVN
jgi:hyperosmotically inducible protein